MLRNILKAAGGLVGQALETRPPETDANNTMWLLTIDVTSRGEGLQGGWPVVLHRTPSEAEIACMEANARLNVIRDTLHDDLIQYMSDRITKVAASKQWRELCDLYPEYFGDGAAFSIQHMRFGGLLFEVRPVRIK